jgi:hypothetical protein
LNFKRRAKTVTLLKLRCDLSTIFSKWF